jgi:hypothetical protein
MMALYIDDSIPTVYAHLATSNESISSSCEKKLSSLHKESNTPLGTTNVDMLPTNNVNNGVTNNDMYYPELFDTKNDSFFHEFWSIYPRKVSKKEARRVFDFKVNEQGVAPELIIAGAKRYAAQMAAEHQPQKYIKYPHLWLDNDRWEDEIIDPVIDQLKSSPHPLTDLVKESMRQDRLSFLNGGRRRLLQ